MDRDLFTEYTTLEDCHNSHDMARNNTNRLRRSNQNSAEMSLEYCHPSSNTVRTDIVSSSKRPNKLSTPRDSDTVLNDLGNDAAGISYTKVQPIQADPTVNYHSRN